MSSLKATEHHIDNASNVVNICFVEIILAHYIHLIRTFACFSSEHKLTSKGVGF
jgi:hypothetical protein